MPDEEEVKLLSSLEAVAETVGRDWRGADKYYNAAEANFDNQWKRLVWPFLRSNAEQIDWSAAMDLACGHGRNAAKLLTMVDKLILVDINNENIEFCRRRFGDDPRIDYHLTNGYALPFIEDDSLTFIYCFDAMVHFDSDVIRAYLKEFRRILRPGGHAFLHHSNYEANPGGSYKSNPGWRNHMSKKLFMHYSLKEDLQVTSQSVIDWLHDKTWIDCFSLLQRRRPS